MYLVEDHPEDRQKKVVVELDHQCWEPENVLVCGFVD